MVGLVRKWRQKHREPSRLDTLLALLHAFGLQGSEESSFPEITDSVVELQKTHDLGYDFPEGVFYCYSLSEELQELQFAGYLNHYEYRHDGFLPKSFFGLTDLGIRRAHVLFDGLSPMLREAIVNSVGIAIQRDTGRWGLFARKRARGGRHPTSR